MIDSAFHEAFIRIATRLNRIKASIDAEPFYELMSGAIIWADERPPFQTDTEEMGAMRMIWNYRTSLIIKNPRTEFRELWEVASHLAPNWPVFIPVRREPTVGILKLLPKEKQRQAEQGAAANP
jgi:hypothetical protein